jgi:drug/metabolite transporter (DMT)-like permease
LTANRPSLTALHEQAVRASHSKGIALVALSTVTWGSGGLFVRLLPPDLGTVLFWRGLFAAIFIGTFVLFRFGRRFPGLLMAMGSQGILITLCSTASTIFFVAGVQHTSVANAFTILAALPFVAAAIAWLWVGERPSALTMVASAIALVGIIIMFRPTAGGPRLGDLLALLGTVAQALMTVAIRRNQNVEILPIAWLSVLLSVAIAIPLAESLWALTPRDYAVAAGFGLLAVALGQVLYMTGSALIPAPLTSLIGTMEAPLAALWAWIGIGEAPPITTFIGGSIVLASVLGRLLFERGSFHPLMPDR